MISVLGVMAIAGLMSGTAYAQFQYGMNYFSLTNWGQSGGDSDGYGPAFQPGGWNATTDGALWISTGGATPVLNTHDVNFELDFRLTPTSPWTVITNTCLLSTGVAYGDVNIMGTTAYPGYFLGDDNAVGWGNTHLDPSPYAQGSGQYWLPGTLDLADYPDGRPTEEGWQFNLYAWTGDSNSFAAAVAGGAEVAISGAFQVGPTAYSINFAPQSTLTHMPSMLLKPSITGDANLDGQVDINDLTVVLAHYGQTGMTWADGEFTGDGTVDINDLTIVLAHYNQSAGSSAGTAAVPEPSTIAIAAAALLGLLVSCRRKPSRSRLPGGT
jgi:hypothetical protein